MDKNTVFGLVLIGLILSVFTIYNQPSEEELKAQQEKLELAEKQKAEKRESEAEEKKATSDVVTSKEPKRDDEGNVLFSELGDTLFVDSPSTDTVEEEAQPSVSKNVKSKGEYIRLENEKLIIDFNSKGGQVAQVKLKEYESYQNYAKMDDKIDPLILFKKGDATNGLSFPLGEQNVNTSNEVFTVKSKTEDRIVFELTKSTGSIEFAYQLKPNSFDIDYDITIKGLDGKVIPQNIMLNWSASLRKTERLFSEQRRVSTVCFKYKNEGFSWLSEMGDDEEVAEDKVEWISFKQSYFSSFLRNDAGFEQNGSKFTVNTYDKGEKKDWTHLKDFSTSVNLGIRNTQNATVHLNWFFGPNDYDLLTSYNSGYDDVLNYGWGLFRWINLYAVQPMFKVLTSTGVSIGIAILLLTLIIKFALMPIQWKMYTSSAKMRILKPEIEEINERFPDKEDAMKKQMETMTLYRESGASPLSGCVPMLIQMPILLAVFRFFPSTFDLRQKSFLWAEDLSSYDSIWDLGVNIWPYGDHVSLFTLLMAGTTLIYTMINSGNMQTPQQPGMPNMKIIMYFFPIMMIFFFNNFSSGLSYYYFISTLASILIMVLIKQFFVDEEKLKLKMAERKAARAAAPKKIKTKSKFQERLEQMQKAQQEQLKNKKKK